LSGELEMAVTCRVEASRWVGLSLLVHKPGLGAAI
jgi:hypothetical protein